MNSVIHCEKCGKKLLERQPNGIWVFKFGKREGGKPVVEMEIHGSLRMTCIRRTCRHPNILHYFPQTKSFDRKSGNTNQTDSNFKEA